MEPRQKEKAGGPAGRRRCTPGVGMERSCPPPPPPPGDSTASPPPGSDGFPPSASSRRPLPCSASGHLPARRCRGPPVERAAAAAAAQRVAVEAGSHDERAAADGCSRSRRGRGERNRGSHGRSAGTALGLRARISTAPPAAKIHAARTGTSAARIPAPRVIHDATATASGRLSHRRRCVRKGGSRSTPSEPNGMCGGGGGGSGRPDHTST